MIRLQRHSKSQETSYKTGIARTMPKRFMSDDTPLQHYGDLP